jgi:hypothetical protein
MQSALFARVNFTQVVHQRDKIRSIFMLYIVNNVMKQFPSRSSQSHFVHTVATGGESVKQLSTAQQYWSKSKK